MSGSRRYLLNTNEIVALLQGNVPLGQLLFDADWIGISVNSRS
jgi:tRNA(fMet)-specific endonuclease VapC